MTDKTVTVGDGKERVALELARWIAQTEVDDTRTPKDRKYLLKLMHECMRAVNGHPPPP